jgi:hypothetical protein
MAYCRLAQPAPRHYAWGGRFCKSDAKQSRKASANKVRDKSKFLHIHFITEICKKQYKNRSQNALCYVRIGWFSSFYNKNAVLNSVLWTEDVDLARAFLIDR